MQGLRAPGDISTKTQERNSFFRRGSSRSSSLTAAERKILSARSNVQPVKYMTGLCQSKPLCKNPAKPNDTAETRLKINVRPLSAPSGSILKKEPEVCETPEKCPKTVSSKVQFDEYELKNPDNVSQPSFRYPSKLNFDGETIGKRMDWAMHAGKEQTAISMKRLDDFRLSKPSKLALVYRTTAANHAIAAETMRSNKVRESSQLLRIHCIERRLANQRSRRTRRDQQLEREQEKVELKFEVDEHLRPSARMKELGKRNSQQLMMVMEKEDIRKKSIMKRTRKLPYLTHGSQKPMKHQHQQKIISRAPDVQCWLENTTRDKLQSLSCNKFYSLHYHWKTICTEFLSWLYSMHSPMYTLTADALISSNFGKRMHTSVPTSSLKIYAQHNINY